MSDMAVGIFIGFTLSLFVSWLLVGFMWWIDERHRVQSEEP